MKTEQQCRITFWLNNSKLLNLMTKMIIWVHYKVKENFNFNNTNI